MLRRKQALPPVGYANWEEAAMDATTYGILVAEDVHGRDYEIVVPEDVMACELRRRQRDAYRGRRKPKLWELPAEGVAKP